MLGLMLGLGELFSAKPHSSKGPPVRSIADAPRSRNPDSTPRWTLRQSPRRPSRLSSHPASRPPEGGHCPPVQRNPQLSHILHQCVGQKIGAQK